MPGAVAAFSRDLTAAWRRVEGETFPVACGGRQHAIGWTHRCPQILAHDLEAESALLSLGGPTPACLALVELVRTVSDGHLWSCLTGRSGLGVAGGSDVSLHLLPESHQRVALAERLHVRFRPASAVVRNSVAKLGLVVLSGSLTEPNVGLKFQMMREFPIWDVGVRPWTDKELVLLHRHLHISKGERMPYLTAIPTEIVARRTIAFFLADVLDDARIHSKRALAERLKPFHNNTGALIRLLANERLIEANGDGYRASVARTTPTARQVRPTR